MTWAPQSSASVVQTQPDLWWVEEQLVLESLRSGWLVGTGPFIDRAAAIIRSALGSGLGDTPDRRWQALSDALTAGQPSRQVGYSNRGGAIPAQLHT